jgi:hypothetical protein
MYTRSVTGEQAVVGAAAADNLGAGLFYACHVFLMFVQGAVHTVVSSGVLLAVDMPVAIPSSKCTCSREARDQHPSCRAGQGDV